MTADYDGIPVDIIGDTATAVVISYTVPASRLVERRGVDGILSLLDRLAIA